MAHGKPRWLVVRCGGYGDNLIATSVLPLLVKKYRVEWIAQEPHHEVLENNPYIDVLTVKKRDELPQDHGDWLRYFDARSKEYAGWCNLSFSCEVSLALQVGQSQFRWNANWRRKYLRYNYQEFAHDVADVPYDFTVGPRFWPTDDEVQAAHKTREEIGGDKLIGVCLSGSRLDKTWPYMSGVISKLRREFPHVHIVLFGGNKDMPIAESIFGFLELYNGSREGVFSAISGKDTGDVWPVRRSFSLLQTCDLVITPDTGAAWAVAMEPMPKLLLLSHASPLNISKHWVNTTSFHADQGRVPCHPCHLLHNDLEFCHQGKDAKGELIPAVACMADIKDEAVMRQARRILGGEMLRLAAE